MPGIELTVTAKICADEEPQELSAVTEIFPLDDPALVLMLFDEEVPDQPPGKVQV